MKLVIPPEGQVAGLAFKICYNDRLLEKMDLAAHISSKDQKIILSHRKTDQEFVNLIHEAVHGVVTENSVEFAGDNEQGVCTIAIGLALFLLSLGIEPDFCQIPEEA